MTLVAVAIAGLLRWLCDPFLGDHLPFVTFFVGVAAAAWLGGLRPALLATGLGFVVAWYFFVPPRHSFTLPSGPHFFGLAMYFMVCLALAAFGEAMHVARRHTEQERAKALAERERFRLAAEAVNGIIYEFDITTGHVERQRGLYEVLGYRPDEVPPTAAWWHEQVHPDDREPARRRFEEAAASGNGVVTEYRLRHKDGRWLRVEDRALIFKDGGGKPVKMIGCTVDVTERWAAVAKEQKASEQVVALMESLTEGLCVLDRDYRYTYVNAAGERTIDMGREELLGRTQWEVFPACVGTVLEREFRRAMAERVTTEFENHYAPWDRWFALKAYPAPDGGICVLYRDITDIKRAEEGRRLLASIVENSPDFIGISDMHGNPLYVNRAAMELVGVGDIEQVRRGKIVDYFVPEQRQFVAEVVLPAVIKDGHWCGELLMQHFVTGAAIPVWYDLFRVDDPATGQPINFATVTRDLTGQKREEERLRQSEARFRAGIEAVSDIVWTNDAQGMMAGEQVGWGNFTGQDRESYQGYGWSRAVHPDDAQPTIDAWNEAVAGKRPFDFEHRVRRSDGQWRLCSIRAVPILDDRGEISEWVGVHNDITDRHRHQEQLRASEERRRLALDAAELGTWHVEPATRATKTDARYRAIFGTTEDWTDYFQAFAVIHPDDLPAVKEAVATATRLEDPTPYAIEYRIVHPDGSLRWVLANGRSSFEGAGPTRRVVSFDGTVADITDRKRSEEERERLVGQLRDADRKKDVFLATLAHELRNPLAPIRNGLQIMKLAGGNPDVVE